ncbi:FKBP-type peptidyl-prolyl cis-trans isomerase [Protaetiibacter larvae]|uniref:peptidylprolyl isomerase n=1 Tax=Protaetiibacter larvae TaxID=2592654 RepID=A0A5C1YAU0_9MICO|nr:FKBP-type peptidyl-prolyl cis-trans isomerase [Protaetiibacter larvae]QEO10339.1 FKBP-type peptidyl-prolyl cis-trans isomerase [Protaetiibacter larvae]
MPRALPALTVAALAVALVGCSATTPEPEKTDAPVAAECASSGSVSESIDVTGELGSAPTVDFDAPLELDATQRTVVIEGDGDAVPKGAIVSVDFTLYNGANGELLTTTGYAEGEPARLVLDPIQLLPGLVKSIVCTPVGSRVVGAVPAADAFGDQGLSNLGIAPGEPVVFVIDVLEIIPARAIGEQQEAPAGFPAVDLAEDGTPTITIPQDFALPTETASAVLIRGAGAEVQATDTIWIQYQGVDAETGEIFDQTWGRGPYSGSASGFITGFTNALVGQTVGSQFIVVIPPKDGYGEASDANTNQLAGKTLIFVVDVLAASPGN